MMNNNCSMVRIPDVLDYIASFLLKHGIILKAKNPSKKKTRERKAREEYGLV